MTLEIVTPFKKAFVGEAGHVILPGSQGEFGVLPGHAALLATLQPGTLKVDGKAFKIGEGFVEVGGSRVVVLTESCEDG